MYQLGVKDSTGYPTVVQVEGRPDRCPICHNGISPIASEDDRLLVASRNLERVFICPLAACNHFFVGRYHQDSHSGCYYLTGCVPTELGNFKASDEIAQISPDFCEIYNQAQKAELLGYTLVSGPGYRKALEFLIKDYLTQTNEGAKTEIASMPLAAAIKKFVVDKRMLTTAERAAWLGNDETHYVRKWEDKDVEDLKKFIRLTCYWIQSEHLTNAAAIDMPAGKN
jgi:hypothetical protein